MVLEATVVCVDNSDFMINGDYKPTRLQAQAEAVNLLAGAKTGSNPENTVGVLSLAGVRGPKVRPERPTLTWARDPQPPTNRCRGADTPPSSSPVPVFVRRNAQVLATPTPDLGRVLHCMREIKPEGSVSLVQGVQIAQLALKHRQNKNQRQRIVAFIGSPLAEEEKALVKVAKKLKKNNVSIDIVSFGEEAAQQNAEKLESFLNAANSNDQSHLVTVPPGTILSDILLSTPVFMGDSDDGGSGAGAGGSGGGAGGGNDFEFGVDPNLDPELALALRVSMEEERARQEAARERERKEEEQGKGGQGGEGEGSGEQASAGDSKPETEPQPKQQAAVEATPRANNNEEDGDGDVEMTDDAILQQALAMSLAESQANAGGSSAQDPVTPATTREADKTPQAPQKQEGGASGSASAPLGFATEILSNLPGVDVSDENVQQVLSALKEKQSPKRSREEGDEGDEEDK